LAAGTRRGVKPSRRACKATGSERQLPHHERALEPARLDLSGGAEDADRGRQVEGGAFLAEVGRSEVDGDALDRELEARVADGGAHPVPTLADGRVGEADSAHGRCSPTALGISLKYRE
jgi:hypothetical protein